MGEGRKVAPREGKKCPHLECAPPNFWQTLASAEVYILNTMDPSPRAFANKLKVGNANQMELFPLWDSGEILPELRLGDSLGKRVDS